MTQEEMPEKEQLENPQTNMDSWMDRKDWEQVQLDQIKLMLSDKAKPDFDLDQTLGFDRERLASEINQWLEGEDVPEFATRQSRTVEEILRKNQEPPQPQSQKTDRPIAPEFETDQTQAPSAPPAKKHWWQRKKQPVPADLPTPEPQPTTRETMPLEEALDRVHADDRLKQQAEIAREVRESDGESIEEILADVDLGPVEQPKTAAARRRWEAEMPELNYPEPEPQMPLTRKEKKAAARQAKKDAKKKAAGQQAGSRSIKVMTAIVFLELAVLIGMIVWWLLWKL